MNRFILLHSSYLTQTIKITKKCEANRMMIACISIRVENQLDFKNDIHELINHIINLHTLTLLTL